MGFHNAFGVDSCGRNGGLWVGCQSFGNKNGKLEMRLIWWFSAIYGPCNPRLREFFWDELAGLRVICDDRWCLGGDFYLVRT